MAQVRAWQAALLAAAATGATVAFVACLDATPVTVAPLDASADALGGMAPDARPDARLTPCVRCIETPDQPGPGCGNELSTCMANTECAHALDCAIANGCFDLGSSGALISCGYPCAQEAGISTLNDPAITLAYGVFMCAAAACGPACHLGTGAE